MSNWICKKHGVFKEKDTYRRKQGIRKGKNRHCPICLIILEEIK